MTCWMDDGQEAIEEGATKDADRWREAVETAQRRARELEEHNESLLQRLEQAADRPEAQPGAPEGVARPLSCVGAVGDGGRAPAAESDGRPPFFPCFPSCQGGRATQAGETQSNAGRLAGGLAGGHINVRHKPGLDFSLLW